MSWGGLLAGAIGGAANVIGKQAGDDIEQSRKAELMRQQADIEEQMRARLAEHSANLQVKTASQLRADEDAFKNDPTRVQRDRINRVSDITAEGAARNGVALAGKKAEAADTELTAATVARENAILKGTMGAKAQAAGMLARATDLNGAERQARTELLGLELKDKKRLGSLYDDFLTVTNDETLTDQEKAAKLKPIGTAIQAIKAKNGQGAPRDPELDTQTVTEEKMNPDGTVTKTSRKEVRRAGQGSQSESAPYPDGTELKGKDGQVYVVQGGQPVLKNKPEAPKKTGLLSTAEPVSKSPKALAREEYLRELEILDQMKNGTQTPTRNRSLIPAQEAKVNRLLQAAQ